MGQDFISLKASIDEWSKQEAMVEKSLECYASTLFDVERTVFRACEAKTGDPAPKLDGERKALRDRPTPQTLDAIRLRLSGELEAAANRIGQRLAGTADLAEVISLLDQTTSRLRDGNGQRETDLDAIGRSLRDAAGVRDLNDFRARVYSQIDNLRSLIDRMRDENLQILDELQGEMTRYRKQLDEAKRLASVDVLTGLTTREQFECAAREYLAADVRFCLFLADVASVDLVRGKHGRLAAERMLAALGHRLQGCLKAGELASRFSGDTLVVLIASPARETMSRSRELLAAFPQDYCVDEPGAAPARYRVVTRSGIAESRQSDTWERVVARAESLLSPERAA